MTKDEALKLALVALEKSHICPLLPDDCSEAITAIKEALAQPEQEPVAFINVEQRKLEWAKYMTWDTPTVVNLPKIPLYTTPPQPWEKFCDSNCVWTDHHPDCKLAQCLPPSERPAVFWEGLSADEISDLIPSTDLSGDYGYGDMFAVARLVEYKLREKNEKKN